MGNLAKISPYVQTDLIEFHSNMNPEISLRNLANTKYGSSEHAEPICFSIHGVNIILDSGNFIARREKSYSDGICFINRPYSIGEHIKIEVLEVEKQWKGTLSIGFTVENPYKYFVGKSVPRFVCPNLTVKPGFWIVQLEDEEINASSTVEFWLDRDGKAYYKVDKNPQKILLEKVQTSKPLWVLLDVYAQTKAVQIIQSVGVQFPQDNQQVSENLF